MILRWQTMGLAREYRLFHEKQIVGILKNNFWNRKGYGELRGFFMRFEGKLFGEQKTNILDIEGKDELGHIEFKRSPRSASIQYNGQRYEWCYADSGTKGSWMIRGEDDQTSYEAEGSAGTTGMITDPYLPPVVLLSGLFIHGYFLKKKVIAFIGGILAGAMLGYALLLGFTLL